MIRFERSAQAILNKQGEAQQWAKEVTVYINTKLPDLNLQVFVERFGQQNSIYGIADCNDLAALDQFQLTLGADQGYWELMGKAQDFFVTGSIVDKVYSSI